MRTAASRSASLACRSNNNAAARACSMRALHRGVAFLAPARDPTPATRLDHASGTPPRPPASACAASGANRRSTAQRSVHRARAPRCLHAHALSPRADVRRRSRRSWHRPPVVGPLDEQRARRAATIQLAVCNAAIIGGALRIAESRAADTPAESVSSSEMPMRRRIVAERRDATGISASAPISSTRVRDGASARYQWTNGGGRKKTRQPPTMVSQAVRPCLPPPRRTCRS